ncbi:MAG: NUDIX domain-containing protein [Novosphingobium sp.]
MLHLIPPSIHRQALRVAHELRKYWWRYARPNVIGCRVLAFDDQDRLLLIRHSYGRRGWMPPGGGIRMREDPLAGACREFAEEVGCVLHAPFIIETVEESLQGARSVVHIVAGGVCGPPVPDGREIVAADFFAANDLPRNLPVLMQTRLPEWIRAATAARRRDAAPAPVRPQGQTR